MAVELDERRAAEMRATLARLRVIGVEVLVGDALELPRRATTAPSTPSSSTRPAPAWARWRRAPTCAGGGTRADVGRLAELQRRLLRRAAALVRPGGALTYSVCTITQAETLGVIDDALATGGWALDDLGAEFPSFVHPERGGTLLTWPPRHHTSGFFVARLRRHT